jgi:hypothetical protein
MTVELAQWSETLPSVVGIVGSRGPDPEKGRVGWPDDGSLLIGQLVARIRDVRRAAGLSAYVVTGDAPSGVDRQVRHALIQQRWCSSEHITRDPLSVDCPNDHYHVFPAYWHGRDGKAKLNRLAGFERNERLVRHCGLLIALFGPDATPGTQDAINRAREWEVPVLVYQNGRWHE